VTRTLALAAATALVLAFAAGAAPPKQPARLQVVADEFNLTLSRGTIRPGDAVVELVNFGEDDHDLALRLFGGTRTFRVGLVHPGSVGELDRSLRAGRYQLWCTLGDHRARGMRATLIVR
jgi:plastocyanin